MAPSIQHLLADVDHVVWDWNGTLIDDHACCVQVINTLLREEGLPEIDRARYRAQFDFPVRRYYERLGFDLEGERWESLAARFIEGYERRVAECRLHDAAVDVLSAVSSRGARSSILSAARATAIEPLLERYGVRGFFTEIVGLDDHYANGKLKLGVDWIRSRSFDRERVILVGDTVHDFEVANAMGIRCVLVSAGHHDRRRLEQCGCAVVDRLQELL